jgi:hypothetical protein
MASAAYNAWVASVKADGGRVTVAPSGWAAAAYEGDTLLRVVAQRGQPAERSANGRVGYYPAPAEIRREAAAFSLATDAEIEAGAAKIKDEWWRELVDHLKKLSTVAVVVFVVLVALHFRKR